MALLSILTVVTCLSVLPGLASSVDTTTPVSPKSSVAIDVEATPLATWCFDCGKGMKRLDMANGVSWFCHYWDMEMMYKPGTQPQDGNTDGFGGIWVVGDGNLALSVVPFWNELGCGGPWTNTNDFFFDETRCYYSFMTPCIDGCNTKGTGHKQGGYSWQYCANVTINPNPDGCSANEDATFDEAFAPGVQVVKHIATAEDQAAAMALTLQHESHASSIANDDATPSLSKREDTECYGACTGIDRSIIEMAIAWFCAKYQGTKISFSGASSGGPLSFADNYTYAEEASEGRPFVTLLEINLAVGLNLENSDNTGCEQEDTGLVVDYETCAVGLISAVDNCNIHTTSHKQGRILHDQCLQFAVAPLPCS